MKMEYESGIRTKVGSMYIVPSYFPQTRFTGIGLQENLRLERRVKVIKGIFPRMGTEKMA